MKIRYGYIFALVIVLLTVIIGVTVLAPPMPLSDANLTQNESSGQDNFFVGNNSGNISGSTVNLSENDHVNRSFNTTTTKTAQSNTVVIIEARNQTSVSNSSLRSANAKIHSISGKYIKITIAKDAIPPLRNQSWVEHIHPPGESADSATSEGIESIDAKKLHKLGVTGSGVKIGVLTGGVDPYLEEYANQVVASKSFHPKGIYGEDPTHGTGVTEIISDTAPDANLYLTSFDGGTDYNDAVDWLKSESVDVIVMSRSFYNHPGDGSGFASEIASEAAGNEIFWANSAGNTAQTHWQGSFRDTDNDGFHNFKSDDEGNVLGNGTYYPEGTPVRIELKWYSPATFSQNYDLTLRDANNNVVAETQGSAYYDYPIEDLSTTLPHDGVYFFSISGVESESTIEVTVRTPQDALQYSVREGSIQPPSVAKGITAVGAYHEYQYFESIELASYSSAGPTTDGRIGLDIVAPSRVSTEAYDNYFSGTSAAAPHIGGAAALLKEVNKQASPNEIEAAMKTSAIDMHDSGNDILTGAGRINVTSASEVIDPEIQLNLTANESTITTGEWVSLRVTENTSGEPVSSIIETGNKQVETGPDGAAVMRIASSGEVILTAQPDEDPVTADYLSDNLSISVQTEPNISIVNYSLSPTNPTVSEAITANVTLTNTGTRTGSKDLKIYVNERIAKTQNVTVQGKSVISKSIPLSFESEGNHSVTVNDLPSRSVSVSNDSESIGNVGVRLQPKSSTTSPNASTEMFVIVSNVEGGIGSYKFSVSVQNEDVSTIAGVTPFGDPISGGSINMKDNRSKVTVTGAAADTNDSGEVAIAELSLDTHAKGKSPLNLSVETVGDEAGSTYSISTVESGVITVAENQSLEPLPEFESPPKDPDSDSRYEDVNGDGNFDVNDVTAIWSQRKSEIVSENELGFDFNEDGGFDVNDVTSLWNQV